MIGYLGFINQEAVPVTLNSKIDKDLLNNLLNTYCPAYLWIPKEEVNNFSYKPVFELFDYVLLKTNYQIYPINEKLQLLMTTSGSTGSPKLVRYKKGILKPMPGTLQPHSDGQKRNVQSVTWECNTRWA